MSKQSKVEKPKKISKGKEKVEKKVETSVFTPENKKENLVAKLGNIQSALYEDLKRYNKSNRGSMSVDCGKLSLNGIDTIGKASLGCGGKVIVSQSNYSTRYGILPVTIYDDGNKWKVPANWNKVGES